MTANATSTWELTTHGRNILRQHHTRPQVAAPRDATTITPAGHYTGAELRPNTTRPGSMGAHRLPSLIGGQHVLPKAAR